MQIPLSVDVPMTRLPVANWLLIGVTCIVSIAVLGGWWPAATERIDQDDFDRVMRATERGDADEVQRAIKEAMRKASQPVPLSLHGDAYWPLRLFSYVLVHADWPHLFGNMLFCSFSATR
jgi:membrane associated rhomboid family serine protease